MTAPASTRHHFETRSFDKAHALIRERWGRHTAELRSDRAEFSFSHSTLDIPELSTEHLDYHATCRTRGEPLGVLTIAQLHSGTMRITTTGDEQNISPGDVFCLMPERAYGADLDQPEASYLRLDTAAVAPIGAELAGIGPSAVRFESMRPISHTHQQHWLDVLRHINKDVLAHDEVLANPLIRAETVRHLVATALATFPNTALAAMTDPTSGNANADPAALRRAVEFIDSHAGDPIGLIDIARVARIGPRALQREFRRHRGCTPLAYLRQVRLDRAHQDLQAADPTTGDSVSQIAARWGFPHTGRFAATYHSTYGYQPSHTLRH